MILLQWDGERGLSTNMNLSWIIALWCWPGKRVTEGKNRWKNSLLRLAPVAQYLQLRTAWSWPRINVSMQQEEKISQNVKSQQMCYMLKQIGIVFFLCHRLSVSGELLTRLQWWLPPSDSLLCTKAPVVAESYYTIKPSGSGMMCNDVVSHFLSCIIWAHLTSCSSSQTASWQGQSR